MSKRNVVQVVLAVLLACFGGLAKADASGTRVLVAKPELRADPVFGSAILVVTSIGGEQHAGFIVNRPTTVRLGSVFRELEEEIKQGLWYVLEPDPDLVPPASTEGLWEELARRSNIAAEAI